MTQQCPILAIISNTLFPDLSLQNLGLSSVRNPEDER